MANAGNTNGLWVASSSGVAFAKVGERFDWPAADGTTFNFGSGSSTNGSPVLVVAGHDYYVLGCADGTTSLVDQSAEQTGFFWLGFSMSMSVGLMAVLGARGVRKILAGGFNE